MAFRLHPAYGGSTSSGKKSDDHQVIHRMVDLGMSISEGG